MGNKTLALKVDCDTFEGSAKGIPRLLDIFREFDIRASFFFSLGPDNTGRAIRRVFTQKGFLKKMLRSKAVSMYGTRTMLSGTLLPAPLIGKKLAEVIRSVEEAGHEAGIHCWDHVKWHDYLDKMSEAAIEADYGRAHEAFRNIFGHAARASAAPGWHITGRALKIHEKYHLLYTSNTRNGAPFFPIDENKTFPILEIPSTLPTWDEALGTPEFPNETALLESYRGMIKGSEVHSIHTEVEGTAYAELFKKQLTLWKKDGVRFVTLEEMARDILAHPAAVPARHLVRISLPNRGGLITSSRA